MAQKQTVEKITRLVVDVLEKYPKTRNDDRLLTFKVMQLINGQTGKEAFLELKLRNLRKLPAFATITRVRALIQNELNKFLPTSEKVRRQRRISEEAWEDYVTGTPEFPCLK